MLSSLRAAARASATWRAAPLRSSQVTLPGRPAQAICCASMMVPSPVPPPATRARSGGRGGAAAAEDPVVDLPQVARAADDQPSRLLPRVAGGVGEGLVLGGELGGRRHRSWLGCIKRGGPGGQTGCWRPPGPVSSGHAHAPAALPCSPPSCSPRSLAGGAAAPAEAGRVPVLDRRQLRGGRAEDLLRLRPADQVGARPAGRAC